MRFNAYLPPWFYFIECIKRSAYNKLLNSSNVFLNSSIAALKGAGEFDLALQLIERRLKEPLPDMLKTRLETERFLLPKLAESYSLTHEDLLAEMRKRVPDFTAEDGRNTT